MSSVKRILITADPQEVRVAVVEGGKLSEAYIERRGRRSIVGNVYKGRVDAVLPGMEAAFVDIGLDKNGFLYVNEIVLPDLDERERRKMRIQELIQPGQDVLVQVTKDPMGTKGARLTMEVSLAGRFMVLVPGGDGIGISRKLSDGERDRLRDLIRPVRTQEDAGMIVRTAAEGASVPELERDVRLLEKLWEVTRGHAERAEAPALVYAEPDLSLQVIRDDLRADVSEVVVDDERQYHRILAYVNRTSPELAERIKLYRGKRALFQRYEIEQGIRSTLRRRVELPSGGSLIFDYAEAFTIVDVNTGRFTGKKRLEDTILKNNLEAAVEVVRQLRLRDIGGIIVIDFIDMAAQKNRDAVLKTIQKELEKDRSKSYVVEISPLGLVEMTRHNVTDGVREILTVACRHCEGTGRVLSPESIVIEHLRELRRVTRESKAEAFRVGLAPEIVPALIGPAGSTLLELENETGRWFELEPLEGLAPTKLEILAEGTRAELVQGGPDRRGHRADGAHRRAAPVRRDGRRGLDRERLRDHRARARCRTSGASRRSASTARCASAPRRRCSTPSRPWPRRSTASPTCSSPRGASASGSTSRAACAAAVAAARRARPRTARTSTRCRSRKRSRADSPTSGTTSPTPGEAPRVERVGHHARSRRARRRRLRDRRARATARTRTERRERHRRSGGSAPPAPPWRSRPQPPPGRCRGDASTADGTPVDDDFHADDSSEPPELDGRRIRRGRRGHVRPARPGRRSAPAQASRRPRTRRPLGRRRGGAGADGERMTTRARVGRRRRRGARRIRRRRHRATPHAAAARGRRARRRRASRARRAGRARREQRARRRGPAAAPRRLPPRHRPAREEPAEGGIVGRLFRRRRS